MRTDCSWRRSGPNFTRVCEESAARDSDRPRAPVSLGRCESVPPARPFESGRSYTHRNVLCRGCCFEASARNTHPVPAHGARRPAPPTVPARRQADHSTMASSPRCHFLELAPSEPAQGVGRRMHSRLSCHQKGVLRCHPFIITGATLQRPSQYKGRFSLRHLANARVHSSSSPASLRKRLRIRNLACTTAFSVRPDSLAICGVGWPSTVNWVNTCHVPARSPEVRECPLELVDRHLPGGLE